MKKLLLAAVMVWAPLAGCDVDNTDAKTLEEFNVNSRYLVESVHISGQKDDQLSNGLRTELNGVVGSKLDHTALDALADRIKKELHVTDVSVKVVKGTTPDHVVVNFEVTQHEQPVELTVPKFLYVSNQGWSAEGRASTTVKGNKFTFGLLSDGDALVERFTGVKAAWERKHIGSDRLSVRFEFDSFHENWNNATTAAIFSASNTAPIYGGLYRDHQEYTPEATLIIAAPLALDFGVSFSRFRPEQPGAKTESSNAVVSTLRYHQRWGSDKSEQELNADYSLRAGTSVFGTDAEFTRHKGEAHYRYRRNRSTVDVAFLAGLITGNAPLFERFSLGNATTLRGWNKFDLDPLGGSHVVHGSVEYTYRWVEAFYDTGAVWDKPQEREQKQSVGVGFKAEGFQLAVAFPIRAGRVEPTFYAGLNF